MDARDRERGTAPKLEAHRRGDLHRAFSVFVFDGAGRLLLQQRAHDKYHSGGRWTNTCCGHPRPGEPVAQAAARRLREEMGFACDLRPTGAFLYRAEVGEDLVEHEYDHVLIGRHDGDPMPDPGEVSAWRRVAMPDLLSEVGRRPERFTVWFPRACDIAASALPRVFAGSGGAR